MSEAKTGRKTIPLRSDLASVSVVEQMAEDYARSAGFDDDVIGQVGMVAREAAVNAILHGNSNHPEKKLTATFEQDSDQIRITIADEGSGFNPEGVPDPLAAENLLRSSGRGIFLMRAYMDEVHFRQLNPGQETVLVKRKLRQQQ